MSPKRPTATMQISMLESKVNVIYETHLPNVCAELKRAGELLGKLLLLADHLEARLGEVEKTTKLVDGRHHVVLLRVDRLAERAHVAERDIEAVAEGLHSLRHAVRGVCQRIGERLRKLAEPPAARPSRLTRLLQTVLFWRRR